MNPKGISRRRFMKTTAGAAGAAWSARSISLGPGALDAAPAKAAAPSDTVRFGIIGVGMRGAGLLATSIRLPGVECAGAAELYDGRATLAREIVGQPLAVTRRYQDLLERPDIDCIIAPSPDHWHKQLVVDCCRAGKDVYVEKPMTHRVEEGFEIIQAAREHHRMVQVGSQEPSSVVYAKAKELIAQGAIGKVCLIEATMGRNDHCGAWWYTIPPDASPQTIDWETWLGSAPKRPFDAVRWARWRCFQDYGEGIPGDLFIHHLTGIHYVMGVTAPPRRAFTQGGLYRWHDGRDVPDCMTTVYDYGDYSVSLRVTLNTETESGFRFLGDHGILEVHGVENPEGLTITYQDGLDHSPCTPAWPNPMRQQYDRKWHEEHDPAPGTEKIMESTNYYAPPDYDDTRDHLWNFFQSVKNRQPSVEDEEFGNNAAIACHMANESYFHNRPAVWDAESKRIRT